MYLPQMDQEISEGVLGTYVDPYPLHLKMSLLIDSFPLCMSVAEKTN